MNIKITSKDGITLKTQGKYCTEDIKINVGDEVGGGATVTKPGDWQGTVVPSEGFIEKVYFNTNLTKQDILNYANQLNLIVGEGYNYFIFCNDVATKYCFLMYDNIKNPTACAIAWVADGNFTFVFDSDNISDTGLIGWNPIILESNGFVPLNEVLSGKLEIDESTNYEVGTQNNLLSSLFSTTPFTQSSGEQVTLEGDYDGSTLVVDELPKGGWSGSVVPSSGMIETLYFNTNLSIDEVKSIMDTLTYETNVDLGIGFCVLVYVNPTMDALVIITKYNGTQDTTQTHYSIGYWDANDLTYIFAWNNITGEENIGQEGWKGINSLDINAETILAQAPSFGFTVQTDKFASIISTTPFTQTKPNTIDVKALIEQKKIPLAIEVKQENTYKTLKFNRDYTLDGIQTYSYTCTEEERQLLTNYISFNNTGLPAIIKASGVLDGTNVITMNTCTLLETGVTQDGTIDGFKYLFGSGDVLLVFAFDRIESTEPYTYHLNGIYPHENDTNVISQYIDAFISLEILLPNN